jgi:hypothetical protein
MLAIPVLALVVAGSMSAGGPDAVLITLESAIRHTFMAAIAFVRELL